ncbi:MAG: Spy/CpxP family protein refolding chaperone [Mariprofundaceae bacterium]|nr:Spy/CpxP family protein refolding chaperone [Mariprofundaceae bacterium]
MNHTIRKITFASIIAIAFSVSPALACDGSKGATKKTCEYTQNQHKAHSKHHLPGGSLAYLRMIVKRADTIGLSDKQRQQVGALLIQSQSDAAKTHGQAEVTVAAFKSKLHADKATKKDIKDYSKKIGQLRADKLSTHLLATHKAKALLNDEQRQALKDLYLKKHNKKHAYKCEQK